MLSLPPPTEPPWIVAHRGASADAPENTLAAIRAAAALPIVDAVELDVQRTKDGEIAVVHDDTPARMGGGNARIGDMTWAALRRLDVGSWFGERFRGERIPALQEILEEFPRIRICIEMKVYPPDAERGIAKKLAAGVLDVVRQARAMERVVLMSFDLGALAEAGRLEAGVARVGLFESPPERAEAMAPFQAVGTNIDRIDGQFVGMARARGLPILVYTCNTAVQAAAATRWGVQAIATDRPAWLADGRAREFWT